MLKYFNYDIVAQEIPDQLTLAINIAGCPFACAGCHSPWLQQDEGTRFDSQSLHSIVERYCSAVTCVCLMGGDSAPHEVQQLAQYVRSTWPHLKTGWYSGREEWPTELDRTAFDFVKLGPYIAALGGLDCPTTNQRLYAVMPDGRFERIPIKRKPQ